jgi:Mn2+/Fe2+ NRAMP family transporter
MLAIPVLAASTAYSVGGLFGWPRGLSHRVGSASAFYVVLGLSFLIGVQLAVMGADPVRSLFYSQVLDGLVAPVLVLLLLLLTSSRRRMGDFVNGRTTIGVVVLTMLVLVGADIAMIASTVRSGLPV